jgi:hypothetical protein
MSESAKYVKIVAWSEADQCYVGSCPGIIGPCCHGDDEVKVYRQPLPLNCIMSEFEFA